MSRESKFKGFSHFRAGMLTAHSLDKMQSRPFSFLHRPTT